MMDLTLRLLICIALACLLSACSTGQKKVLKVAIEVGENCEHIDYNSEEWRDCMMDESRRIAGNAVIEAIEEEIQNEDTIYTTD